MTYKKKLKVIKNRILEKERSSKKIQPSSFDVPLWSIEQIDMLDNCLCTDRKHQFKEIYISEHEAEKQAKYLNDMLGITISVYPCPYNAGWHLTQR